jgi:hypothetical protein
MRGRKIEIVDGKKLCAKCGETKTITEYGANKQSPTGLTSYCKTCLAAKAREMRATPEGKKRHYESTVRWIEHARDGVSPMIDDVQVKLCLRCRQEKTFNLFPKNRRTKHGIGTYCLTCSAEVVRQRRQTEEGAQAHRDASKKWREANKDRHADNNARRNYGIEHGGYDQLLAAQEGKCAICKTTEPGTNMGRFAIDHCHSSGAVRGLLCSNCNRGLGYFKDDPDRILRAISYLSSKPS